MPITTVRAFKKKFIDRLWEVNWNRNWICGHFFPKFEVLASSPPLPLYLEKVNHFLQRAMPCIVPHKTETYRSLFDFGWCVRICHGLVGFARDTTLNWKVNSWRNLSHCVCLSFFISVIWFDFPLFSYQKQPPEVFCVKSVLRNVTKFTRKHLCQSLFFNKVAGLY